MTKNHKDRTYPLHPQVGVGIVLLNEDQVLLIKRGQEPAIGKWTVPGGLVKIGETIHEAAKRELMEECGIAAALRDIIDVFEFIERDRNNEIKYHYIVVEVLASYEGGQVNASSDAVDAKWCRLSEIDDAACTSETKNLVRKAFAHEKSFNVLREC